PCWDYPACRATARATRAAGHRPMIVTERSAQSAERGSRDRPAAGPADHGRLGLPDADAGPLDPIGDSLPDLGTDRLMATDCNEQSVISQLQSAQIADYARMVTVSVAWVDARR